MDIPGENLSLIIHFALDEVEDGRHPGQESSSTIRSHGLGPSPRSKLSLISGFSLACHRFRQIALRETFRTYHVTSPSHLHDIDRFPDIYKWVRLV